VTPHRVLVDHAEEHTLPMIQERGFWAGITLYPQTKVSAQRAVDMIEVFGSDRICVASACDWGPSVPTAVAHFVAEMRRRGHSEELIRKIVYDNPVEFLGQSPRFRLAAGKLAAAVG
jgi:predicted metal-dependent TIM-barrel fold hydrolase